METISTKKLGCNSFLKVFAKPHMQDIKDPFNLPTDKNNTVYCIINIYVLIYICI